MNRRGYTIIELLVVISMMGILFGYASWSITNMLPKWRLQGAADEVVQQFQQARAEAVRRNKPVVVEFTSIGSSTSSAVRLLEDGNNDYVGDTLIMQRLIPDAHTNAYIKLAQDGAGNLTTVAIGSDGTIKSINGAGRGTMPITITLDSVVSTTPDTYRVIVDRSGAARVKSP